MFSAQFRRSLSGCRPSRQEAVSRLYYLQVGCRRLAERGGIWEAHRVKVPCLVASRWLSTAATNLTKSSQASQSGGSSRWHRLAIIIRYTRIPILIVSVYSLGYQQGVIDCTKTPVALQEQILKSILLSTGVTALEDVDMVAENEVSFYSRQTKHQVAAVGSKIVTSARQYVQSELQKAMDARRSVLPPDISDQEALKHYDADSDVQLWYQARLRLEGEALKSTPWRFLFIKSEAPNAFVTEILPHTFFITTAMLKVAETPDELAIVLGHEISHLILGHVTQTNQVQVLLRTAEVLLLTMDPTAGLLSIFFIAGLAALRGALSAAHSRENEREADELGLILAARACFDTTAGSSVMYKMHQLSVQATPSALTDSTLVKLMDTHPPSLDRWERMRQQSQTENYTKYSDQQCAGITSRLFNALWGSSNASKQKDGK